MKIVLFVLAACVVGVLGATHCSPNHAECTCHDNPIGSQQRRGWCELNTCICVLGLLGRAADPVYGCHSVEDCQDYAKLHNCPNRIRCNPNTVHHGQEKGHCYCHS